MRLSRKVEKYKTCPRCGLRNNINDSECADCGLIFSRLEVATNKEAKRKILRNDRDFIVKTSKLPNDVSFIKLLLLSIFTGIAGGHLFYVGRYLKGTVLLLNFLAILFFTIFNAQIIQVDGGRLIAALMTISGFIMFMWPFDMVMIIMKKFKVPVAIDIENTKEDKK